MSYCLKSIKCFSLLIFAWMIMGSGASVQALDLSPAQGVWDATGNYPNNEFDATNNINLLQDNKGKITGFGTGFASDSGIDVNLVYNFTGSMKGGASGTRVSLNMRVSGTATDGFITLPVSGNIKMSLDLDRTSNILVGLGSGKLCVQRRCTSVGGPVQFDIPQPMDGSWTLTLDTQTIGGKVSGTATAELSNGRLMSFTANGNFSGTSKPGRINLKGPAGTITLEQIPMTLGFDLKKAKLLGQTVGPRTTLFP